MMGSDNMEDPSHPPSSPTTLSPELQEVLVFLSTGGFTVPQRKAIAFMRRFISITSLVCACLLIHMVLRKRRNHRSDTLAFHRFLLGLSIFDVLFDIWLVIGSLAVPRNPIVGGFGAHGTTETCTAQGFFMTMSLGPFIYNAGLSIYYVLVIRYGVTERTIARYFEPTCHILAFAVPLTFGIRGLATQVYNPPVSVPPESGCFASPYPALCLLTGPDTCERGRHFAEWITAFFSTELSFIIIVVVMSAVLYWTVRAQYRASNRSRESQQMRQRTRAVACQAFLFAITCVYTGIWNYLFLLSAHLQGPLVLQKFIVFNGIMGFSSQGFFNFLIYTRPRYNRIRQRKPEQKRWDALMEVIFGEQHRSSGDNRHRVSSVILRPFMIRPSTIVRPSTDQATQVEPADERRWWRRSWKLPSMWTTAATTTNNNKADDNPERAVGWGARLAVMLAMTGEDTPSERRRSFGPFRRRSSASSNPRQQQAEIMAAAIAAAAALDPDSQELEIDETQQKTTEDRTLHSLMELPETTSSTSICNNTELGQMRDIGESHQDVEASIEAAEASFLHNVEEGYAISISQSDIKNETDHNHSSVSLTGQSNT